MRRLRLLRHRLRSVFMPSRVEDELDRELRLHLEALTREALESGADACRGTARRAPRVRLDGSRPRALPRHPPRRTGRRPGARPSLRRPTPPQIAGLHGDGAALARPGPWCDDGHLQHRRCGAVAHAAGGESAGSGVHQGGRHGQRRRRATVSGVCPPARGDVRLHRHGGVCHRRTPHGDRRRDRAGQRPGRVRQLLRRPRPHPGGRSPDDSSRRAGPVARRCRVARVCATSFWRSGTGARPHRHLPRTAVHDHWRDAGRIHGPGAWPAYRRDAADHPRRRIAGQRRHVVVRGGGARGAEDDDGSRDDAGGRHLPDVHERRGARVTDRERCGARTSLASCSCRRARDSINCGNASRRRSTRSWSSRLPCSSSPA